MVSVCMATYNGSQYLHEQMQSILDNLEQEDELIISDDNSTDNTRELINEFMKKDKRVFLVDGPCLGVVKNFENAISKAKGDILFLSDQDDIWKENKIKTVMPCFAEKACMIVLHDAEIIDGNGIEIQPSFFEYRNSKKGLLRNIIKNSYIGCCMAFRKELVADLLPFPESCGLHDQWIGTVGEIKGDVVFLEEKLISYRRHEANVSDMQHLPVDKMIKNRLKLIWAIAQRWAQCKKG